MAMIDARFVEELNANDFYAHSHHASDGWLGTGILYYALPYLLRAELCVCLGSGSGFVPKLMRQAQRDTGVTGRTILIDANLPEAGWGTPDYHDRVTWFRQHYPEVEIWQEKTDAAAAKFPPRAIDVLHIDADHSYEWVKRDFDTYLPLMKPHGIVTLHDTISRRFGVWRLLEEIRANPNCDVVDFQIGQGTAVVKVNGRE